MGYDNDKVLVDVDDVATGVRKSIIEAISQMDIEAIATQVLRENDEDADDLLNDADRVGEAIKENGWTLSDMSLDLDDMVDMNEVLGDVEPSDYVQHHSPAPIVRAIVRGDEEDSNVILDTLLERLGPENLARRLATVLEDNKRVHSFREAFDDYFTDVPAAAPPKEEPPAYKTYKVNRYSFTHREDLPPVAMGHAEKWLSENPAWRLPTIGEAILFADAHGPLDCWVWTSEAISYSDERYVIHLRTREILRADVGSYQVALAVRPMEGT